MPDLPELSQRELEILKLVATGASNKQIAQQLFISINTVKVHLRNIFTKIGANSRTEAAMYAVNCGIVDMDTQLETYGASDPSKVQVSESHLAKPNLDLPGDGWVGKTSREGFARIRWFVGLLLGMVILVVLTAFWQGRKPSQQINQETASVTNPIQSFPRWNRMAAIPTARFGLAVVPFGEQLFAIGGETTEGVTGRVESFTPRENRWSSTTEKPTPVSDISAAVVGGKIYVPGGRLNSGAMTDVLEVFDPLQNRWSRLQPLPAAISAYALASFEGKLYLFGGWDGTNYQSSVYMYEPDLDRWSSMPPMPSARAFAGAAAAGNSIYIIGGNNELGGLVEIEIFNPGNADRPALAWKSGQPMPHARIAPGVVSIADIIYVVGGEIGEEEQVSIVMEYFPLQDEWQGIESILLNEWAHLGVAGLGTQLYMIGGQLDGAVADQNLSYQAVFTVLFPVTK